MKIKRAELIKLVRAEIHRIAVEDHEKQERDASQREIAEKEYVQVTGTLWEEFARRILDAVIDEVPITRDLAPPELRGPYSDGIRFWDSQRRRQAGPPEDRTKNLRVLLRFLEVTLDDEISTTGLERQGFSLGKVLRGTA